MKAFRAGANFIWGMFVTLLFIRMGLDYLDRRHERADAAPEITIKHEFSNPPEPRLRRRNGEHA